MGKKVDTTSFGPCSNFPHFFCLYEWNHVISYSALIGSFEMHISVLQIVA